MHHRYSLVAAQSSSRCNIYCVVVKKPAEPLVFLEIRQILADAVHFEGDFDEGEPLDLSFFSENFLMEADPKANSTTINKFSAKLLSDSRFHPQT